MPTGREKRSVLVIARDPTRCAELARPFSGPDTQVIAAANPLEGLWSAPDVAAVIMERGTEADVVDL